MAFGHFLLGSHNLMVTSFGTCVKFVKFVNDIIFMLARNDMSLIFHCLFIVLFHASASCRPHNNNIGTYV